MLVLLDRPRHPPRSRGYQWASRGRPDRGAREERERREIEHELGIEAVEGRVEGDNYVTKFDELGSKNLVHRKIVANLTEGMNLVTMTDVQSETINRTLRGEDV